jgi:hypothetical protein
MKYLIVGMTARIQQVENCKFSIPDEMTRSTQLSSLLKQTVEDD